MAADETSYATNMWANSTLPPFDSDSTFNSEDAGDNDENTGRVGTILITLFFVVAGLGVSFSLLREYLRAFRPQESSTDDSPNSDGQRRSSAHEEGNGLIQGITLEQRKAYVLKMLNTQLFKSTQQDSPNKDEDDETSLSSLSEVDDSEEQASVSGNNYARTCAICLEALSDTVCTSNNEECHHVFHRACALKWLLKNEDCPCCRRPYLSAGYTEV